ncbi:glycoside hydrolase family 43 protein [Paenibacillus provencensis]|uniref:Glycoside hydrolase family 43 protein n=1 Tax=Paenibacillus provencensis TaxID=441151 RepID=A0ABW3Q0M0_9BACL|nr:glycoside hydrolase family 43 protein [Paenibacillus sp. MER 78]MCM3126794.1 glycoside hydrolase family 43 protein [Paenibacillus sp. MER 78]
MQYTNPVISGFHPDPSICRVGEDYYLVTSSFQYFPGVPIFHSIDLVNWKQLGHVLTTEQQLPLRNVPSSCGIFAPTLRYHEGWFYMVTTNVGSIGNFYVKTQNPAGSWSDPILVAQDGIDPSLLFDRDGSVYFQSTRTGDQGDGIYQCEIDIETGEMLTDSRLIWKGTGGSYPEAPHLYQIGDYYYLMLAEGGTEYGHMETIARSKEPYGPFEACPHNPILSHRSLKSSIHATGHADIIEAHDGSWWAVLLGVRPASYPMRHHLGREVFLAPVTWTKDQWPMIGEGGRIEPIMDAPEFIGEPLPRKPIRDEFDEAELGVDWIFLRNPRPDSWSLSERTGYLVLRGDSVTLDNVGSPAFIGRRLSHFNSRVATSIEFDPAEDGDESGLTVYMNEKYHYELAITSVKGCKKILFRRTVGSLKVEASYDCPPGPVQLEIQTDRESFTFSFRDAAGVVTVTAGSAETAFLSTEVAGGFTGVMIAMYAASLAGHSGPSYFDWYEYEPKDE